MPAKAEVHMLFKSKAPEKAKNAAANATEVTETMGQQQHSLVEQVAASPPVGAASGSQRHPTGAYEEGAAGMLTIKRRGPECAVHRQPPMPRLIQVHCWDWTDCGDSRSKSRAEPTA